MTKSRQNALHGRILLVEDHRINQIVVQRVLEEHGLQVIIAENGRRAVELLGEEEFDIVLMDVRMPVMDGLAATREIRSGKWPGKSDIPIIALTAHALEDSRKACMEAGMNDFLSKPFKPQHLIDKVHEWIGQH